MWGHIGGFLGLCLIGLIMVMAETPAQDATKWYFIPIPIIALAIILLFHFFPELRSH